jgi:hypothetical protein
VSGSARHGIEEAGHGLQASARIDDTEIRPLDDRRAVGRCQFPRKTQAVSEAVHIGRAAEGVAGETFVDSADHRVDPVVPVAREQGVEIRGVCALGRGDQFTTARRVGFVPRGEIAVDQVGMGVHHRFLQSLG